MLTSDEHLRCIDFERLTEETVGYNTEVWPQKGARDAKAPLFLRLLRLFAANSFSWFIGYGAACSVRLNSARLILRLR